MEAITSSRPGAWNSLRQTAPGSDRDPWLAAKALHQAQDRRLFYLLISVWVLNAFDLMFTLIALEQQILVELNPVAARLVGYGPSALTAYKLGLVGAGTALLWYCRRHRASQTAAWCILGVCVLLCLVWYQVYLEAEPLWVQQGVMHQTLPHRLAMIPR